MMGNRLLEGKCLRCGEVLLADYMGMLPELHLCSSCDDFVRRSRYEVGKKRKKFNWKYYKHGYNLTYVLRGWKNPE
jgi:hypothetical protein